MTVVDQTGAVIPNATVTVTPSTDPKTPVAPVQTGEKGVATLPGLAPGRYSIHAEFPGFEPRLLKDVQLKAGDNKHVVVLALQGVQDSVTVVARRARSGVGPAGHVRHRDDARADRRAVGRSRRDGAAAAGSGRRRMPSSASTASRAAACRRSRRSRRSTSPATRSPPRTTTPAGSSSTSSPSLASVRCAPTSTCGCATAR